MKLNSSIEVIDVSRMGKMSALFAFFLKPVKETLENPELGWRLAEEDKEVRDIILGNAKRLIERFSDPKGVIPMNSITRGLNDSAKTMRMFWVEDISNHQSPGFSPNYLEAICGEVLRGDIANEFQSCNDLLKEYVCITRKAAFGQEVEYDSRVPEIVDELTVKLAGLPEAKARITYMFCVAILHRILVILCAMMKGDEEKWVRCFRELHPYYLAIGKLI